MTVWLREAKLPGGDAAARHPVQAAAGFLSELDDLPDLTAAPFDFPERYTKVEAFSRKRHSDVYHDVGWPALRHGGRAAGLYASDYVRRAGGDVGRASCLVGGERR